MRLLGYFALVFAAMFLLRHVPVVGELFRVPFLGFVLAAAVVSAGVSWYTVRAVDGRRAKVMERQLGAVDTPHNQGKLGSLILAQGRARRAIPHLERAAAGEANHTEWHYRLGCAYLSAGRAREARAALERAVAQDEEHAYGAVTLRLSQARLAAQDADGALEALARFERNHGPSPESAYRRGLALRAAGKRAESQAAFAEVAKLAAHAARFQKGAQRGFVWLSYVRRVI